jgi:hypothetical protein
MTTIDDETRIDQLLAPLATIPPVSRRKRSPIRRSLVVALVVTIAVIAGGAALAIAGGGNPFAGISGADHPATNADTLDPALRANLQRLNERQSGLVNSIGQLQLDNARLLADLPSGRRLYVIPTDNNQLCIIVATAPEADSRAMGMGCGNGVTQAQPTTEATMQTNASTPPLSFGVANDSVSSVSFTADGTEKTIPVTNNVWYYEGDSDILRSLTVHFKDGTSQTLTH